MTTETMFTSDDLELLLDRYTTPATDSQPRRPPWTWAALNHHERAALARMIDTYIDTYNRTYAVNDNELLPPCWRRHPALAAELAVQVWLWYATHMDPNAAALTAGDYYLRHLPSFQSRIDRLLGISPGECRRNEHHDTWRQDADELLTTHNTQPPNTNRDEHDINHLGALHFGFPHLNNNGQQ